MEKLKAFRKSEGLSQDSMARVMGITLSFYEKVESGRANASSGFLVKFKRAFPHASIDDIFFTDNRNNIADCKKKGEKK